MINYGHVAVVGLLQWLKLLVLSALTLLVASYARTQLFVMATGFLLWVAGHLQPLAHLAAVRSGATVGGMLTAVVARMVPNFQVFDLGDAL